MKKTSKLVALILSLAMVFSLAACSNGGNSSTPAPQSQAPATEPAGEATPAPEGEAPAGTLTIPENAYLALVTDVGNIDDKSFNQGAYEGMVAFAEANNIKYDYFRPSEDSTAARVETITTAIEENGATVVVLPGFMFGEAIAAVQDQFPDVMFLALDVASGDLGEAAPSANVALITYQEEQAGYLAGYAAVKDGYTKLGFLGGMAVPAVIRYGYGFVQGADAAAKEMGITVDMKYWYGNTFGPNDDVKVKMDSWYSDGTEVVFACGGGIYLSAVAAADAAGGKVIGVDVDQSAESPLIVTSAMKELANSVGVALTALYENNGTWPAAYAGKQTVLGAAQGSVGLPTAADSWRLGTFTVDEYNALFEKLVSGEIVVSDATDTEPTVTNVNVDYQG